MWTSDRPEMNPGVVLANSAERADVVQGLVPQSGITWLYGASMSYKTFAAMSIAVAVSQGRDWLGRKTEPYAVLYVGAEGGAALHLRRAAAELDTGGSGVLCLVQERPQLDTPEGGAKLQGIIEGFAGLPCYDLVGSPDLDEIRVDAMDRYQTTEDEQDRIASSVVGLLCVIDTYSQTAGGDDKTNVAAYIKNLRDVIENARMPVAFIVVDHATKAGGSYMGSVAKLNDVDSQLEMLRTGDGQATLYQRKVKDGVESAPIQVDLVPYGLEQYRDAYGAALGTLVVRAGGKKSSEGKAGVLLGLLKAADGSLGEDELRTRFAAHGSNTGIKAESVGKAFKRAKDSLLELGLIRQDGENVALG